MRKMKLVLCLIPGMVAAATLSAAAFQFQSAERRAALLEVFTSEGCSSCPPAESWLSHLKEAPGLWNDFVPVAFHVDYWDYLGWRDRWASKEFSDRQRAFAQSWGIDSLYLRHRSESDRGRRHQRLTTSSHVDSPDFYRGRRLMGNCNPT
jgi:hypothetical protein